MTTTFSPVVRGVALGDAWGSPNEFQSIDMLTKEDPMGPDVPERLRITDDTQMTLYLADALDVSCDADMDKTRQAIMDAFLTYNDDPDNNRAPGMTVTSSLNALARGEAYDWQAATSTHSDGSGTAMRTSPCAFLSEDRWVGITAFAAAVTHGTPNGIAAAILNTAVLRRILSGLTTPGNVVWRALEMAENPRKFGLLDVGDWLDGFEVDLEAGFAELARLLKIALDKLPELQADPWGKDSDPSLLITDSPNRGGGWRAHETVVIALLAADMFPGQPIDALRRAVTTDGDSDTIGAVAGGLLGALYPEAITAAWDLYRDRFEGRYIRWIELEADEYQFAPVVPVQPLSWFKRLLKR